MRWCIFYTDKLVCVFRFQMTNFGGYAKHTVDSHWLLMPEMIGLHGGCPWSLADHISSNYNKGHPLLLEVGYYPMKPSLK